MGTLSLTKAGRLFWLGRYTERVYTSLKASKGIYDKMVDGEEADYASYCAALGIPNTYTSTANFCRKYLADKHSPCSLVSVLGYAYDNAIVLRDTIGTETFSYIQLACNAMEQAISGDYPELELQNVQDDIMAFRRATEGHDVVLHVLQDDIMAFRGSAEYSLMDETSRTILRTGANVEYLSLALRLKHPKEECRAECERLLNRLYKIPLATDENRKLMLIDHALDEEKPDLERLVMLDCVEHLFPEV